MTNFNMALNITSSFSLVEGFFVQSPILETIQTFTTSHFVLALARELSRPLLETLQEIAKQDLIIYIQTMQRLRFGEALKELEEYEEAIETLKEVIKIQPKNYNAWLLRSICLMLLGELEQADRSFDRTLEKKQAFDPHYYKALIALLQDRPQDALDAIDTALTFKDGQLSEVFHDRARILEKLNRFEEASQAYDEAIKLGPNNHAAKINRSLLKTGNYKTVEELIRKAAVLLKQKEFGDGLAYVDRAIEKNPQRFDGWKLKGDLERSRKNYSVGIQAYKKAIEIQEDSAESYYGLGISLFKLKKFQSSSKALMTALDLGYDEREIWLHYGLCKYNLNHCRKALHGFSKVCETWPQSIIGHLLKGHTFRKRGDYKNALISYQAVLKKRPGNLEAITCSAIITYYQYGELEEALTLYRKAQRISPDFSYYQRMVKALEKEIELQEEERRLREIERQKEVQRLREIERQKEERHLREIERQKEVQRLREIKRQEKEARQEAEYLSQQNQALKHRVSEKKPRRKWFGLF